MKQARLWLFFALVLLLMSTSLAGAQSAFPGLDEQLDEQQLVGMQLPRFMVGTERVLLYVDCEPLRVDVAEGTITAVAAGERDDATLKVGTTQAVIRKLIAGEFSFMDAAASGDIIFEPVSLKNRIKLFFAGLFSGTKVRREAIACGAGGSGRGIETSPSSPPAPREFIMTILPGEKHALEEPVVEISVGDKVTFINNDTAEHLLVLEFTTVADGERKLLNTVRQPLALGEEKTFSFAEAGEILIHDELSDNLRGKIVVLGSCTGCFVDGRCLEVGAKLALEEPLYCSAERQLVSQKAGGDRCSFGYECLSDSCNENRCAE